MKVCSQATGSVVSCAECARSVRRCLRRQKVAPIRDVRIRRRACITCSEQKGRLSCQLADRLVGCAFLLAPLSLLLGQPNIELIHELVLQLIRSCVSLGNERLQLEIIRLESSLKSVQSGRGLRQVIEHALRSGDEGRQILVPPRRCVSSTIRLCNSLIFGKMVLLIPHNDCLVLLQIVQPRFRIVVETKYEF